MRQLFVFLGILAAIVGLYAYGIEAPAPRPHSPTASPGHVEAAVTAAPAPELVRAEPAELPSATDADLREVPLDGLIPLRRAPVAPEPELNHTLRGRVLDERGRAVPAFRLTAQRNLRAVGTSWEDVDLGAFENGSFVLDDLPAGSRWILRAEADGYHGGRQELVPIPAPRELELELTRDSVVSGRVFDPHGNPVAGASVVHRSAGRKASVETNEVGGFEIGFATSSFELVASAEAYAESEVHAGRLSAGEVEADIELVLRERGGLTGELLDERGKPLAGWSIRARSSDQKSARRTAQTDHAGRFLFDRLAPGQYVVTALQDFVRPDSWALRDLATVTDGETTHLILGGIRPDSILVRGRLTDAGEPAPGFRLWALSEGEGSFASGAFVETDAEGRFELGLPHSGPTVILAGMRAGGVAAPFHVQLSDEPVQDIELALPTGRIGGLVVENGEPPERRKIVRCVPEGHDPITTQYLSQSLKADSSGHFAFEGLPQGSYRLSVVGVIGPTATRERVRISDGEWRDDVLLQLSTTGRARVTVVDTKGLPVQGAILYAHDGEGRAYGRGAHVVTKHDGQARFRNLEPGAFRFFARKDGVASKTSPLITIREHRTSEVSIRLTAGSHLRVSVADGDNLVRARIRIQDEQGRDFSGLVDPIELRRYFTEGYPTMVRDIGPLAPGRYHVLAVADDGRRAEVEVELEAGVPRSVTVELP